MPKTAVGRNAPRASKASPAPGTRRAAAPRRAAPEGAALPAQVEDIRDAVMRLKRERIIAAAVELFYRDGFGRTTLEAVAERLGVTKPFIYSHFASKGELLAEICSRGIRASLEALDQVLAAEGPPTAKVERLARDFMLAVLDNQAHVAICSREEKHLADADRDAIDAMRRDFDARLGALLREGVAAGEFAVDDHRIASLAIGGLVSGSHAWFRPDDGLSKAETADCVAALVLAMLKPGAAAPGRRRSG